MGPAAARSAHFSFLRVLRVPSREQIYSHAKKREERDIGKHGRAAAEADGERRFPQGGTA
jgi:hypothetical protein